MQRSPSSELRLSEHLDDIDTVQASNEAARRKAEEAAEERRRHREEADVTQLPTDDVNVVLFEGTSPP